jgi:hypothetical protein
MRNTLRSIRDWGQLLAGWTVHAGTRHTPAFAYQALIRLFCRTGGESNDRISEWLRRRADKLTLTGRSGVLGTVEPRFVSDKCDALREHGYIVFPQALPAELCDRLMDFARETPAKARRMDGHQQVQAVLERCDPERPAAVRYDYPTQSLLEQPDIQGLLADPTLLAIAQEYLGAMPKADILSMWWHTNFHSQPDSEAAQLFHFDMDRIQWLKVFIYLTDVGPKDGAHSFVAGSHKTYGIPARFLQRGYVRLSDHEVLSHYGRKRVIDFCAPKGTVIIEDTRGLHKGNVVQPEGQSRLMLQLQYSNSLFGADSSMGRIGRPKHPALVSLLATGRPVLEQFL